MNLFHILHRVLPLVGAGVIVWLVFFMPPLVLRGSGGVADARVYCGAKADDAYYDYLWSDQPTKFGISPQLAADQARSTCFEEASVNVPLLLLQVAVCVAVTLALLWLVRR